MNISSFYFCLSKFDIQYSTYFVTFCFLFSIFVFSFHIIQTSMSFSLLYLYLPVYLSPLHLPFSSSFAPLPLFLCLSIFQFLYIFFLNDSICLSVCLVISCISLNLYLSLSFSLSFPLSLSLSPFFLYEQFIWTLECLVNCERWLLLFCVINQKIEH